MKVGSELSAMRFVEPRQARDLREGVEESGRGRRSEEVGAGEERVTRISRRVSESLGKSMQASPRQFVISRVISAD